MSTKAPTGLDPISRLRSNSVRSSTPPTAAIKVRVIDLNPLDRCVSEDDDDSDSRRRSVAYSAGVMTPMRRSATFFERPEATIVGILADRTLATASSSDELHPHPTDPSLPGGPPDGIITDDDDGSVTGACLRYFRPLIDVILWPILRLYQFVFLDSITPDDDFMTRVRKIVVGGLLMAFLIQLMFNIPVLINSNASVNFFIIFTVLLPMAIAHIGGFVYCRRTKQCPDWVISVVSLVAPICRCFVATTNRTTEMEPVSFGYLMVALSTDSPFLVELCAIGFTVLGLTLNTVILQVPSLSPYLLFPDANKSITDGLFKHIVSARFSFVLKTIAVMLIIRHFYHLLSAKDSAVKLSRELAVRLQRYDTKGAWKILRRGREHGGHATQRGGDAEEEAASLRLLSQVDPELLKAFEGIVENLERYRPFLPNYVFDSDEGESKGGGEGGGGVISPRKLSFASPPSLDGVDTLRIGSISTVTTTTLPNHNNNSHTNQSHHTSSSNHNNNNNNNGSSLSSVRSPRFQANSSSGGASFSQESEIPPWVSCTGPIDPPNPPAAVSLQPPPPKLTQQQQPGHGATRGSSSNLKLLTEPPNPTTSSSSNVMDLGSAWDKQLTANTSTSPQDPHLLSTTMIPTSLSPRACAAVNMVSVCIMSVERNDAARVDFGTVSLWNAFVKKVSDVALGTGASLHSFLGDRLIATWNATKRTAKPETRSCQFALRVRQVIAVNPSLRFAFNLSSMIVTKQAECCFAGDSRLRLFACSSPELWSQVYAGLEYAERFRIAMTDRTTKDAAVVDVNFRGAALSLPSSTSTDGCGAPNASKSAAGAGGTQESYATTTTTAIRQTLRRRCWYELLQERTIDAHNDQEWMYALQQQSKDPNEQLCGVIELCAAGRSAEGMHKLQQLRSSCPEMFKLPSVEALMDHLRLCEEEDKVQISVASPLAQSVAPPVNPVVVAGAAAAPGILRRHSTAPYFH